MCNMKTDIKQLDLLSVGDLLRLSTMEFKFYVASYQRGYRWNAEQAEQLVDDLLEFKNRLEADRDAFYCIQPLVVKLINCDGTDYLEVIDGQQRLTTILIILQALRQLQYEEERDDDAPRYFQRLPKEAYEIKYETRLSSTEWLPKLPETLFSEKAFEEFDNKNCDYSHFAEVFKAVYNRLHCIPDLTEFKRILKDYTYFIWYQPSKEDGNNVEIFDRLNAGKIGLNNAELVKALFVQSSNVPPKENAVMSERDVIQKIALEWNDIECRLHDEALWGFIYSEPTQGLLYETRIEYLLDLQTGKTAADKENHLFTFNAYLDSYRRMMHDGGHKDPEMRIKWVKKEWDAIKNLFDLIMEWYEDRHIYHRIGFILEYNPSYNLKRLQEELPQLSHSARIEHLDGIIRQTVGNIRSEQLFYGKRELGEILFLYNILLEDRRYSDTARFSFADYRQVRNDIGWDKEHVASSQDLDPDEKQQKELAKDVIELITGKRPLETEETDAETGKAITLYSIEEYPDNLNDVETMLCKELLSLLNQREGSRLDDEKVATIYHDVLGYFNPSKVTLNGFFESIPDKEKKNFIWNLVLLNTKTNRSYGNNLFPVKRRRILDDDFHVYTPVGTRNVFEKAYSRNINDLMAWTPADAKAYWADIRNVVKPYVELSEID